MWPALRALVHKETFWSMFESYLRFRGKMFEDCFVFVSRYSGSVKRRYGAHSASMGDVLENGSMRRASSCSYVSFNIFLYFVVDMVTGYLLICI